MIWGTFWTAIGALAAVAAAMIAFQQAAGRRRKSAYTVEGEKWVFVRGWSYADLLHRLIDLDHLTLAGADLTAQDEGTAEQWAPVFQKSPQTWALIVYDKKLIVGYWSYFSVSDRLAARIEAGTLRDCEITADQVKSIREPGPHTIYFGMVARHPDMTAKGDRAFRLLMRSMLKSLHYHLERVDIQRAYAVCFTSEAARLCRDFNFAHVRNTESGRPLFVGKRGSFDLARLRRLI